jgi:hypothetical protein
MIRSGTTVSRRRFWIGLAVSALAWTCGGCVGIKGGETCFIFYDRTTGEPIEEALVLREFYSGTVLTGIYGHTRGSRELQWVEAERVPNGEMISWETSRVPWIPLGFVALTWWENLTFFPVAEGYDLDVPDVPVPDWVQEKKRACSTTTYPRVYWGIPLEQADPISVSVTFDWLVRYASKLRPASEDVLDLYERVLMDAYHRLVDARSELLRRERSLEERRDAALEALERLRDEAGAEK